MCGRGVISSWKVEHESEVKIVCMLWWWRLDIFFEAKRSRLLDYYSVRNRKDGLVGGGKRLEVRRSFRKFMFYQGKAGTHVREISEVELVGLFGQLERSNSIRVMGYGMGHDHGRRGW